MKSLICTLSETKKAYDEFMSRFEQKMLIISNKIF
ncbi:hypothetical protein Sulba_0944 [Sulfurospirillum barnesii SES-3]|uniref:Uncharacterized protein n=1 Tax=Sulfurospirillum barnesii (strain ATCC 700032 / DSM 10660 / SES-3) TaxID=760154 RepID=I3XWC1_SULBS|nr:hypothetical protein Sulba_0944 [Sulfurospirillum barnesii SES-3]